MLSRLLYVFFKDFRETWDRIMHYNLEREERGERDHA
jgi:hypothetical protein